MAPDPSPPRSTAGVRLRVLLALSVGVLAGLGGYTFVYAKGYSYLSNDPAACANCHIMREQLDGWTHGSHRAVATCNDCHTPANLVGKYSTKAQNGFWHSFYFTTGRYPDPIRITPRNREVTEGACRKCHGDLTESIEPWSGGAAATHRATPAAATRTGCLQCHATVGHLK